MRNSRPTRADEPPPTEEELELERDMEYFAEPEDALGPHGTEI